MMRKLNINVEKNGRMVPVGVIEGNSRFDASFRYLDEYMNNPENSPISLSLPLQEDHFSSTQTAYFFEGLLPEGFIRRSVANYMHVDESDYLSILHGLGRECLGALSVTEDGDKAEAMYEPIINEQIGKLAAEGATKSAEIVTKTHLSLTGASGKVGLYYDDAERKWYLPYGMAPSTHIVKQSHVRLDSIVTNEMLSLQTAALCGIDIPSSFIVNTGEGAENEVLLATKRYDRLITDESAIINGLRVPLRLHQEDFSQALGIPSSEKYEHDNKGYMKKMFDVLRIYSSDPIADQLKLWDIIIFDYLIGNTDAHIKNFSLLYSPNMSAVRLAPAYDIVSTVIYEQSTRNMSFSIGGKYAINEIDEECFRKAARECGLGEKMAIERLENMRDKFQTSLKTVSESLTSQGYSKASELADRILRARK